MTQPQAVYPDAAGHFGAYGGRFVPEALVAALDELTAAHLASRTDPVFLAELDRLVQQMEGGQLPLDQLLDGYRRGAELLAYCRGRLQAVEDQVKVLEDGALKAWEST